MPNKTRTWTKEELELYKLIDTSPRPIRGSDIVSFYCGKCGSVIESKISNILDSFKRVGKNQFCKACRIETNSEKGKSLIGDKNPFFGKKHSEETKDLIKKSSRSRWNNTPQEEKNKIGEDIRKAATEKYNGNPMLNPEVKEIYKNSIKEFFSDEDRVAQRQEKIEKTNLENK